MLVWYSRVRVAFVKSAVKLGGPVDRRFMTIERRLKYAVRIYVLELCHGSLLF